MAYIIEFEGIDGSGKTTALKYFVQKLKDLGYRVLETREVGSPHVPVCVKLREIVLDPNNKLNGTSMEFIFAAMRIENQKFYKIVDKDYDFIVSDRGWFSHLAYTDHNVSPYFTDKFYHELVSLYTRGPDRVMFLVLDPKTALQRRHARNDAIDAIEAKGPSFQHDVYNSFIDHMDYERNIHVSFINADGSIESVREQLDTVIRRLTGTRSYLGTCK